MKGRRVLSLVLAGLLLTCGAGSARAQALTPEELRPALEQLLRERPEILLNFLRDHCESVLDIAQQGSDQRRLANFRKQWAEDAKVEKKVATKNRPRIGSPNAKVQIIAFSDFTCHYCQRAEKTVEELIKEYSGRVSFVFKNMPLEAEGISGLASQYFVAISMQSEDLAWKFYRTLFQNRDDLLVKGEAFLRETAADIGVNMKKMDSQRRQKAVANILKEDQKDADELGIEGTPYFLVNNLVIRGAVPKNLFREAIEIELAK